MPTRHENSRMCFGISHEEGPSGENVVIEALA